MQGRSSSRAGRGPGSARRWAPGACRPRRACPAGAPELAFVVQHGFAGASRRCERNNSYWPRVWARSATATVPAWQLGLRRYARPRRPNAGRLAAVEVPVGAVEVPVGDFDVEQHELTLRSNSARCWSKRMRVIRMPSVVGWPVEARRGCRMLPGVGGAQLVDLDAEALQQRLLELELQRSAGTTG